MLLLLLTSSAFAQIEYNVEKVSFRKMLYVHHLSCVTSIGPNGRTHTELRLKFDKDSHPLLAMNHENPRVLGCDQVALSELLDQSMMRFGFVSGTVTVTKS